MDKKYVVYTCITHGYDTLRPISVMNPNVDYICFTDDKELKNDKWQIRYIDKINDNIDCIKQQRCIKIRPDKVFENDSYEYSLWVDANITITCDVMEYFDKLDENCLMYTVKHPQRNCIYKEADAVKRLKKDNSDRVDKQIKKYKNEGFPNNFGLIQSNIIFRKHNDKEIVELMALWEKELKEYSHRDQLSFDYARWKVNFNKIKYFDDKKIYKVFKTSFHKRKSSSKSNDGHSISSMLISGRIKALKENIKKNRGSANNGRIRFKIRRGI